MIELLKIVGVSAVLSAGYVTASEIQARPGSEPASTKIYNDRLPQGEPVPGRVLKITYASAGQGNEEASVSKATKGDMLQGSKGTCAYQAWPNIAPECVVAADGTPRRAGVRMITVEQREGLNTSLLVRMPAAELAQR